MNISFVALPTFDFRYRTRSGPRLAGLRMLLILVAFFISFGTNICIKPNFAGKDLHQVVSAHFSKVSIKSESVSLTCRNFVLVSIKGESVSLICPNFVCSLLLSSFNAKVNIFFTV